jgi:two-component system osmolarity sensor histidine kinase EnvZ
VNWPRLTRRSLFGRSAFAILTFMLLFQIIGYYITANLIVWPLVRSSAEDVASLIELSAHTVVTAPPEQYERIRAQIVARYHFDMQIVNAEKPAVSSPLPFAKLLQDALTKRLGQPIQVVKKGDRYSVDIPAAERVIRFSFPHSRIGTDPVLALGLMFGITVILSFAAAISIAYTITGHLRDLGRAAARVGQGHALQLDAHAGVEELDELVHSFNHMATRIQALLQNHTTLLAGISHDLRSPLTRAKIALELAETMPDATTFKDLGRYLAQLENLITEFLDFSRGVVADANTSLELSAIVAQVCRELSVNASPVQFIGKQLRAICNQSALQRVIRNLIENAQRYSNAGVVEVAISSRANTAVIEIHDRGPGIAEAERERVFLPFVRLEASRNPATGGSGLGLAIVKEICRVHYWQIALLPRPGGGLTALLEIPLSPKVPET